MKRKNISRFILTLICLILLVFVYPPLDNLLEKEFGQTDMVFVERIVDGDTIEADGITIRLLGINTPEKGEEYYSEAKAFLEKEILNKTIGLKFGKEKKDLYNRTLAYVFFQGENINQKIISGGFANAYFPSGKDAYFLQFLKEWEKCVEKSLNYCEKSKEACANCIKLEKLDYGGQEVLLRNICGFSCNLTGWEIKDEGRKTFLFPNYLLKPNQEVSIVVGKNQTKNILLWERETYVWTKTGDTLFLRDRYGKLVLWKNY